ncbi:MAG: TonB family protein [Candidatus Edwardsbacteria bacterium]
MKKPTLFLKVLSLSALVAFSCAREGKVPKGEKGGTIIIGTLEEPSSLNPLLLSYTASWAIPDQILLRLHRFDKNLNITPELAEGWRFSEDFRQLTYHLRRDVKWSDGKPVTSADVKFTYEKMLDPKTKYPHLGNLQFIERLEVIDDYTIKFVFKQIYADELLDTGIPVLPRHIANFDEKPISDGPYKVDKWAKGERLELMANENFFRGRPYLDRIVFRFFPDENALLTAMQKGEIDVAEGISPVSVETFKNKKELAVLQLPSNSFTYIGWNLQNPILAKKEIRKALSLAIDRQQILSEVLKGLGVFSNSPVSPNSWAYNQAMNQIPYDLTQAKAILTKDGWNSLDKDGFLMQGKNRLEFVLMVNQDYPLHQAVAQLIQSQLAKVGVKVNLALVDGSGFVQRLRVKNFDGMLLSWTTGFKMDPTATWHSNPEKGRFNLIGYTNPQVDTLIETGLATLSRRKAKRLWDRFQEIIAEDAPCAFLFISQNVTVVYKGISGPCVDSRGLFASLNEWWVPTVERNLLAEVKLKTQPPPTLVATAPTPAPVEEARPAPTRLRPINPQDLIAAEARPPVVPAAPPAPVTEITAPGTRPSTTPPREGETKPGEATAPPPPTPTPEVPPPPTEEVVPPTEPEVIETAVPVYPEFARQAGIKGKVFVQMLVGADGTVKEVKVLKGIGGGCDEAAIAAAKKFKFKPGTRGGKPAEYWVSYPFKF